MLTTIALLAAPALPAQSIERRIEVVAENTATAAVQPALGSMFTSPGTSSSAIASFDIPGGDRVTHVSSNVSTYIEALITVEVTALDPTGTRFSGSYADGAFACESGGCRWGIFDFFGQNSSLANPSNVVPQGESRTFVRGLSACGGPCDQSILFTPAGFSWPDLQASPHFQSFAEFSNIEFFGESNSGSATDFQLDRFDVSILARSTVETTARLDAAPLQEYCTSPAGSTGTPVTLSAYGSQQQGTEYLTIRGEGFPANSFAVLFVGTAAVSQPMATLNLCVGGAVRRQGGTQPTGSGTADFHLTLDSQLAGSNVYVQSFFRDSTLGIAASNAGTFTVDPR